MSVILAVARFCSESLLVNMSHEAAGGDGSRYRMTFEGGGSNLPTGADSSRPEEDEEPDFMSDEFIIECSRNDVRPGLLMKHSDKRRHDLMKKQEVANEVSRSRNKPLHQLEAESREKSLNTQIGSDNKGFQLLQKMGYKPGTSIGKNQDNEGALKEPIPIVLKRNRLGLGEKSKAEQKKQKMSEWKEHLEQLSDPTEYRTRIQANKAYQQNEKDLRKAQSCCQTLDLRNNKQQPSEPYFWPEVPKDDAEGEEDEEEETDDIQVPAHDKLSHLVNYLRDEYFYCIWCGAEYDDADDFSRNCPGQSRDDH